MMGKNEGRRATTFESTRSGMDEPRLNARLARWLTSAAGREVVAAAAACLDGGDAPLRVGRALHRSGLDAEQAAAALSVAQARRRARATLADADRLLFTPDALQQASRGEVAAWRARRFQRSGPVTDLCSGAGLDALALAASAGAVTAVDVDEARLVLLRHNAAVREAAIRPVVGDALRPPVRLHGLVHADPSRRSHGRRARRLAGYQPPVGALLAALRPARGAGIVLSPGVALDDPDLPAGELEFLQVGADLVEAVVWLGALRRDRRLATATLLPGGVSLSRDGEPFRLPVGPVGRWLLEPAPAAVRARVHTVLGAEIGARRIAARRALLTSDTDPPSSPWWRAGQVEAELPLRARAIRAWLRAADPLPLEIVTHGVELAVEQLWRELGRPPRGPAGRRLHVVRLDVGARVYPTR